MYTNILTLLLLFFLAVSTTLAVPEPFIIPLIHKNPEAVTFNISQDGLLATVETLTRYKRDLSGVPITTAHGSSVIVTCKITMGPQRTPFTVLLDTGSPLLALPTPGCKCDSGAPNPPYSRSANAIRCTDSRCKQCCRSSVCNTNECAFGVTYADGTSLNGSVYEDVIELGGLKSTILFGGITQQSPGFVAPDADGILGFSQDGSIACMPSCMPPAFSVFVKNGLVANSFGIYLDVEGSGELSLGGIDPTIAPLEDFKYAPLLERSGHYRIAMNHMKMDGNDVLSKITILLDTGTTYMLLPRAEYQKLLSYMQEHYCHLTGVCNTNNVFNGNCIMDLNRVAAFPDLVFQFDGLTVTVTPANYFLHTTMRGREGYCFGILPWSSEYAIFGYTFMRGNYVHYDMENRRIGFAGSNVTLGVSSSSSILSPSLSALFFVLSLLALFF